MSPYRAVANGNIVDDVPLSLVVAGIYERVEEGEPESVTPPAPAPAPVEADVPAGPVAPMGTADVPKKATKKTAKKRAKAASKKAAKPSGK